MAPRVDLGTLRAVYGDDDGAVVYEALWQPVIRPPALSLIRALPAASAGRLLDIGAGTGALTEALHDAAPVASIVAVDPSAAMLRLARNHPEAMPCLADASALPIADASVDAVLLAYVLFHLLDPGAGVREAARVLRAGGVVGTVTWAQESAPKAARVWDDTLTEFDVPTLPDHGNHTGLDTEERVGALLRGNGFVPDRIWYEPVGATFTPDTYVRLRSETGYNRARLTTLDSETRTAVMTEARARFGLLDPADFVFKGSVICGIGTKSK
jgi:SAM-dependent methyltransferase